VVIAMLILGTYWSIAAYNDWTDNPVLTTVKTSALKIENIDFPALTICSQGISNDIIRGGFFNIFYKYTKQLNISYGMSPIRTAKILKTGPNNPDEIIKIAKIYELMSNDSSKILTNFLNNHMPGFTVSDPLIEISPIMASMNPYAYIRMSELNAFNITNLCSNVGSNQPICPQGFSLDPKSRICYMAINETKNIWDASTNACSNYRAELVRFDNDFEVQGAIELLKNGNNIFFLYNHLH
jgi:Amiloride-sensitive sodium channel